MNVCNNLILIDLTVKHALNEKVNPSATENLVFLECLIPQDSRWLRFHCKRKGLPTLGYDVL